LRAKASLQNTGAASWNVTVRNNTNSDALYAVVSTAFTVASSPVTKNLTAGLGWASDASVSGVRASAAFAILDTIYSSIQTILAVAPGTVFPALVVYWSEKNTPSEGDPLLGEITSTSFTTINGLNVIYAAGKAGVDTDEFDESVIAHEFGHYLQAVFSRDDSVGGKHTFGDKLDMRVAFSEGWGNAWSGIATGRTKYIDTLWSGTMTTAFSENLNAAPPPSERGWFSESSVQYMLFNLNTQLGFAPIWQSLKAMRSSTALSSIYTFNAGLPASASQAMSQLMVSQGINGTGPFGVNETGNADLTVTLPIYRPITVGAAASSVCASGVNGTYNKAGNWLAFRFTPTSAGKRTITVSSTRAGADPDFYIFQNGVQIVNATLPPAAVETATTTMTATEAVLLVTDAALIDGGVACLDVQIK
jgi:hypothetical protein